MSCIRLFLTCLFFATATRAVAQQAPTATTSRPLYGTAEIVGGNTGKWFLALADGVTPNPQNVFLKENGKSRQFADEAAVLNYLYEQGWEVIPNGAAIINATFTYRYLLKRRTP